MSGLRSFCSALATAGLVGCSCSGLETAGETHPYVRCATAEVPDRSVETAAASVRIEGRVVTLTPHAGARLAIVRGPAVAGEPFLPALDRLEAAAPSAVVVVGDLGDDAESARATFEALASLDLPSLVLPGGRDRPEVLSAAASVEHAERIVDLSGVRAVHLGPLVLVPAPGAPDGRYALDEEACGLGVDDVEEIASALPAAPEEHRVLLSWAAARPSPGVGGAEAGSALVADLAGRVGALGVIASFGATTGTTSGWDVRLAAPAAVGATELPDGTRPALGPLVVDVSDAGLTVVAADGILGADGT